MFLCGGASSCELKALMMMEGREKGWSMDRELLAALGPGSSCASQEISSAWKAKPAGSRLARTLAVVLRV